MPDSAELIPKILRTGSITEDTIPSRMNYDSEEEQNRFCDMYCGTLSNLSATSSHLKFELSDPYSTSHLHISS